MIKFNYSATCYNRGTSLTKDDLTNGLKTDELMHCEIVKEYNNPDIHNEDHYPHFKLTTPKVACKTSQLFGRNPRSIWLSLQKSTRKFFRTLQQSGNHGDFGDFNGDDDFANYVKRNQLLLYLHEFVHMYPDI